MHKQRIFGLDVLRAVAILTVVYGHIFYVIPNHVGPNAARLFFFDGVNIFFTLSGYLIGGILLKTLSQNKPTAAGLLHFWRNRWWRTLPAYFFILIAIVTFEILTGAHTFKHFIPYFFFLQNIKTVPASFTESWSLSVEEWFYLTTPIMLFLAARLLPVKKAVPVIVAGVFLLGNAIRIYRVQHYGVSTYDWYMGDLAVTVPCRIDAVMFGVLGAYLAFYNFKIWTNCRNLLFWVGVTGFLVNHFYGALAEFNMYNLYFNKQVGLLFVLMVIPKLSLVKEGKGIIGRMITFIALISYSIYLVHGSVFHDFVSPLLPVNFWLQLVVYLVWAFGGGFVLYNTVERWGMRKRERRAGSVPQGQVY